MLRRHALKEQPIIRAMTRVPTIGGIPYPYWGMMFLISTSSIVVFKSFTGFFVLLAVLYVIGRLIARYDMMFMSLLMTKLSECPSGRNDDYWGCKSYDPW